jgi:hypothetical protein
MQKITFKDYEKAIRSKYLIEKDGEYAKHFNPTAQANLRDLCWERFKENENKDDSSTFFSFFTFSFELDGETKKKLRDETDRFRTIASFYLKEEKKTASRYAVELAAILVDFQPRPFKKFREAGIIIPEKPINAPKVPFAFNNNSDHEQQHENEGNEDDKENYDENQNESIFDDALIANNQLGFFGNFKNKFSKKFSKKLKKTIIAMIVIFGMIGTAVCVLFFKKGCMQWSDNHYELVYCDNPIEGNLNEVILRDDNLLNFKKLMVCDTTTCFKPDGEAIVWYAKTGDKADFFNSNGNGRHPETKRSLRPITEYIKRKYKGDCLTK